MSEINDIANDQYSNECKRKANIYINQIEKELKRLRTELNTDEYIHYPNRYMHLIISMNKRLCSIPPYINKYIIYHVRRYWKADSE